MREHTTTSCRFIYFKSLVDYSLRAAAINLLFILISIFKGPFEFTKYSVFLILLMRVKEIPKGTLKLYYKH